MVLFDYDIITCVNYLNPRKGTETKQTKLRTELHILVNYLNPRKGTETSSILSSINDKVFNVNYLNPRKGTETIKMAGIVDNSISA